MARYIDADKLEKHFIEKVSKYNLTINNNDYPVFLVDHTLHEIRNFPTVDFEKGGDEICVNADCPMVADYCPVPNNEGVCRYEERTPKEKGGEE